MLSPVLYLKFVAFSVVALSLAACTRMSLSDPTMFALNPIQGDPPASGMELVEPVKKPVTVEEVEQQLALLDAKIVDLKKALEVMSPKTRVQEFAVSGAPGTESATAALYQPAPDLPQGKSLFRWADACTTFAAPQASCRTVEPVRAAN
jgi:hypothetical protein